MLMGLRTAGLALLYSMDDQGCINVCCIQLLYKVAHELDITTLHGELANVDFRAMASSMQVVWTLGRVCCMLDARVPLCLSLVGSSELSTCRHSASDPLAIRLGCRCADLSFAWILVMSS